MTAIESWPVGVFIDELASAKPTPGGGSAAALMAAMAAALVSMVCHISIGKAAGSLGEDALTLARSQAERLRRELTGMIEEDIAAFEAVMRAYRLPRQTADESVARGHAIEAALKQATLVPLRCCRSCQELMELAGTIAEKANRNVVSDAGVAVLAAHAGLRSAALNVFINTKTIKDAAFVEANVNEVNRLLEAGAAAAQSTYEAVMAKIAARPTT